MLETVERVSSPLALTEASFSFAARDLGDGSQMLETFRRCGIVKITGLLEAETFRPLLASAAYFFGLTARKLGIDLPADTGLAALDAAVGALDARDADAYKASQGLVAQSMAMAGITQHPAILDLAASLLGVPRMQLNVESGGGFIPNQPSNLRRLYTYHSEAHWLPMRKRFVNVWLPLFRAKRPGTGTMRVLPYSHLDAHEFVEYRGHGERRDNTHYTQYEVPREAVSRYAELALSADPGDVVLFDRNLLHSSEVNQSADIGYLFVNRYFDVSRDLTISANMNLRPYSAEAQAIGRPLSF